MLRAGTIIGGLDIFPLSTGLQKTTLPLTPCRKASGWLVFRRIGSQRKGVGCGFHKCALPNQELASIFNGEETPIFPEGGT